MNFFPVVSVLLAFLTCGLSQDFREDEEWELDFVQILLRDGISTPDELYPNDQNDPDEFEEGLGQLTLEGQKYFYALGKVLRKRYNNFLTTNPQELKTRSTYHDKCMSSTLCLLASLYEPTPEWEFIPGLKWQPIPIHYEPPHADKLLKYYTNFEAMDLELSPDYKEELEKYKKQMSYWTTNSGMSVKDFFQASALYQILSAELASNYTIPAWAWKYWDDLKSINDYSFGITFANDFQSTFTQKVGGPLVARIIKNAFRRSENKLKDYKIFIFSGQSYHLAGVLGSMKLFDGKEPPLGATLIFELFKRPTSISSISMSASDYAVKLLYFNKTEDYKQLREPTTLVFPGCEEICPLDFLEDFKKY